MFPENFISATEEFTTYEKAVPAPLFKKEFVLSDVCTDASVTIGSKGYYELWLNGKNISDGFSCPFTVNTETTVFYRQYNVSEHLKVGKNTIFVLLGNGFANPIGGEVWEQDRLVSRSAPAFAMELLCGSVRLGAEDFLWTPSPLLHDDYRTGTYFDARVIDDIKNDNVEWHAPILTDTPSGVKRLLLSEPIREIRRLKPTVLPGNALRDYRLRDGFLQKLHTKCPAMPPAPKSGGFILDFGENVAGVPCLKIKGDRGQIIHMQFTELLFEGFPDYINVDVYPDGCAQQDIYVCRGGEEETYIPSFTYHGCRYCYVYGITPEQLTEDFLTFIVIRNDVPMRSDFECSEEVSNLIFRACRRSDESNLHHILTDCPAREKNGWTGDAAISADHFLLGYGAEECMRSWMRAICDSLNPDGSMAYLVPSQGGVSDSVVWDSVLYFMPYYCFKYSGDTRIISETADAMIKNLTYHLSFRDERGIVDRGMGDWLPVGKDAYDSDSPLGFCCTAVMYEMCRMGVTMFNAIGHTEYAEFCRVTGEELREAIRREYIEGGVVTAGKTDKYRKPIYGISQTSQALGLFFGIFNPEEEQEAVATLVGLIREKNDSFDCGFLGLRAIFYVLSDFGYAELVHKMITKPTHPSFANMIYRGETTVWERFSPPGWRIGSHNHHFMSEPSMWYVADVLGIRVNPEMNDSNKVIIKPCFIEGLSYARGYYENADGRVDVAWERESGKTTLTIKTHGNIDVTCPLSATDTLTIKRI